MTEQNEVLALSSGKHSSDIYSRIVELEGELENARALYKAFNRKEEIVSCINLAFSDAEKLIDANFGFDCMSEQFYDIQNKLLNDVVKNLTEL